MKNIKQTLVGSLLNKDSKKLLLTLDEPGTDPVQPKKLNDETLLDFAAGFNNPSPGPGLPQKPVKNTMLDSTGIFKK